MPQRFKVAHLNPISDGTNENVVDCSGAIVMGYALDEMVKYFGTVRVNSSVCDIVLFCIVNDMGVAFPTLFWPFSTPTRYRNAYDSSSNGAISYI